MGDDGVSHPVEVIGLGMFAGLIMVAAEPIRVVMEISQNAGSRRRYQWLCVGPRRTYEATGLDHIALGQARSTSCRQTETACVRGPLTRAKMLRHRLWFVAPGNKEICEIPALSEGEGRWIADQVLRFRKM